MFLIIEPRALHILGKYTTEVFQSQPYIILNDKVQFSIGFILLQKAMLLLFLCQNIELCQCLSKKYTCLYLHTHTHARALTHMCGHSFTEARREHRILLCWSYRCSQGNQLVLAWAYLIGSETKYGLHGSTANAHNYWAISSALSAFYEVLMYSVSPLYLYSWLQLTVKIQGCRCYMKFISILFSLVEPYCRLWQHYKDNPHLCLKWLLIPV